MWNDSLCVIFWRLERTIWFILSAKTFCVACVLLGSYVMSKKRCTALKEVEYKMAKRFEAKKSLKPISQKHLIYSRAYVNFNEPEDVIEFAEFFSGHAFVNEKGTQFKAIVEYAPSQRVPKKCSKKDGREGTLWKDAEYLEFLEFLSRPVESLPSAEIQLERKEAERAGAPKDVPIVTPLMDYVRKKRAAKGGTRRTVINGKTTKRLGRNSSKSSASGSKRGSEKSSTTMYVIRDSSKGGGKDKSTYLLVSKQDQKLTEKSGCSAGTDSFEGVSGSSGSTGIGKKILLLKGKDKEIPVSVYIDTSLQQSASSPPKTSHNWVPFRQNQQQEPGGKIIRSILLNSDTRRNQAPPESHSESQTQTSNKERDKRPPRIPSTHSYQEVNGIPEDKGVNSVLPSSHTEKRERWMKNKYRPDRGVWAPLRRSDGSHSSNDFLSSSASRTYQPVDSTEDMKKEMRVTRGSEYQNAGGGRGSNCFIENGSYRHGSHRSSAYYTQDSDAFSIPEGKPSKRGVSSGYGPQERQVWVQKSSSPS